MKESLFSLSKKFEVKPVGGGAFDAPAIKCYDLLALPANSKHFGAGRRGRRPLQISFFDTLKRLSCKREPFRYVLNADSLVFPSEIFGVEEADLMGRDREGYFLCYQQLTV